jgi:hypothetical protein
MNDLEQELRAALRRCDPSEGFAERVLALLPGENKRAAQAWHFAWPVLRWAIAAVLCVGVAIGIGYRVHEQRIEAAQGLAARQQVMMALQITGSKLRVARQKVKAVERATGKTENTL